jgi:hypothetical protein
MLYRWIAALVLAINLIVVLPAPAAPRVAAGSAPVAKSKTTLYVFGFTNMPPPRNHVLLGTFPPGTSLATINAFVQKEKRTGKYTDVRVFSVLIP